MLSTMVFSGLKCVTGSSSGVAAHCFHGHPGLGNPQIFWFLGVFSRFFKGCTSMCRFCFFFADGQKYKTNRLKENWRPFKLLRRRRASAACERQKSAWQPRLWVSTDSLAWLGLTNFSSVWERSLDVKQTVFPGFSNNSAEMVVVQEFWLHSAHQSPQFRVRTPSVSAIALV